ncbi:MAG: GH116 family glycosyl-hydrolase [Candidatus Firestonebacteria bacterium]
MLYEKENLSQIAFPLGGIGTGSISLGGRGNLQDFEIFNRPNKGYVLPFTFFGVRAKAEGVLPVVRLLQSAEEGSYTGAGHGIPRIVGSGLPHMESNTFLGKYPFAFLNFKDKSLPVKASIEAYNPFIPLDSFNSSLPAAVFNVKIKNTSLKKVKVTVFACMSNPAGYPDFGGNVNRLRKGGSAKGIFFYTIKHKKNSPRYGNASLTTSVKNAELQAAFLRAGWFDSLQDFWDRMSATGEVKDIKYSPTDPAKGVPGSAGSKTDTGAVCIKAVLKPGEEKTFPFCISWYFPNFEKYWGDKKGVWKNYYAGVFKDSFDVAEYASKNADKLYKNSKLYVDTLFKTTMPPYVLDAVSSQASILKTATAVRLSKGELYLFEGCDNNSGSCEGSCTHVENYSQTTAFLFPDLQRSLRELDYKYNMYPDGKMGFRIQLPIGSGISKYHPAADGQMGGIMKLYREWKLCGNDKWLRKLWPAAKKALEYAWSNWDKDKDGVMEGVQHNTYDVEFYGKNSFITTWYLGALKAGAEIAEYLEDKKSAKLYRSLAEKGRKKLEKETFNGKFFIQLEEKGKLRSYQYGCGCLSDQVIGQGFAHITGLGYILTPEKSKKTLQSIFKYNWMKNFKNHNNCQRTYALNDEAGLLLCTWPKGGRPKFPFPYSDEVWCGIEYQVASHMIYEGLIKNGLTIVKGLRNRYNGKNRNPWDEIECGHHYIRSLASWSILTALSGFSYDGVKKEIGFDPKINKNSFKTFFSTGSGWGLFTSEKSLYKLSLRYGTLNLRRLNLPAGKKGGFKTYLNGKEISSYTLRTKDNKAMLGINSYLRAGDELTVR